MRLTAGDWKRFYEEVADGKCEFEHVLPLEQVRHLPRWVQGYLMEQAAIPPLPADLAILRGGESFGFQEFIEELTELHSSSPEQFRFGGNTAWYRNGYLRTAHWISKRAEALNEREYRCQRCGAWDATDVHHLRYHLFFENVYEDLEVLCRRCHGLAHGTA